MSDSLESPCTSRSVSKRPSHQQKEMLVDWLENHVDVANDKMSGRSRAKEKFWNTIASELNSIGTVKKNGSKWRKFWSDLRNYTKNKQTELQKAEATSGINGTRKFKPLSGIEERILSLITPVAIHEAPEVVTPWHRPELEIEVTNTATAARESEMEILSTEENIPPPTRKQKRKQRNEIGGNYKKFLKIEEEKLQIEKLKLEEDRKKTAIFEKILVEMMEIKSILLN